MAPVRLRIGTRGSPLALWQARDVRDRLVMAHGWEPDAVAIEVIKTTVDRIQDRPLSEVGGKGLFTKEIEDALLAGHIDLAVHSMKDVATVLPDGLAILCVLPREDPRDAFVSFKARSLAELPAGSLVGTASLRRQAQVLRLRPDLQVSTLRGNVDTRLRKLAEGAADATLLALAGLNRLGLQTRATAIIPTDVMLPAIAQGAIGIEARNWDGATAKLLEPLNDVPTAHCIAAERAFLARLDGSCRTPIAGLATLGAGGLDFRGMILSTDGKAAHETRKIGAADDGERLGRDAADELLAVAGPDFLAKG
jgi:hydroxymethylbilane synthase